MADKSPPPQVKIGHYILGDTLGTGTFGKVKSKWHKYSGIMCNAIFLLSHYTECLLKVQNACLSGRK